jgi:hypothetical protein
MNRLISGLMGTFGAMVIEYVVIIMLSALNSSYPLGAGFDLAYIVIPITAIIGLVFTVVNYAQPQQQMQSGRMF